MCLAAVRRAVGGLVCAGFLSFGFASTGASFTFSNTNLIALNESLKPPTPAGLYPSTVTVTGLTGLAVSKATVTIHGLSHTFPSDVSILLVGPQGQSAILMSETGGQNRYSVTDLTITLDDDASSPLPIDTSLVSGTFRPTEAYVLIGYPHFPYDFPPPAPPGNSNSVSVLSVFKNTDPNGAWNLFVVDDSSGDTGSIAGGWSLTVSVGVPLAIARSGTNVVLSWPTTAVNCSLQYLVDLKPASLWSNTTTVPITNSGRVTVTNPLSQRNTFYRLIAPLP
jgi:subtilisin-like proprotein convertase family protein